MGFERLANHFGGDKYLNDFWTDCMKFCTDIHGPKRLNPKHFSDGLTFLHAASSGQNFLSSCEVSKTLTDILVLFLDVWSKMIIRDDFSSSATMKLTFTILNEMSSQLLDFNQLLCKY